ncbi:hypothetical protein EYF80_017582 [Liparis tanakae]|uniref:Uncharacterized protein n=1 Tax=Liparis tanakae TaxID=230148 RepID=A0A4Z2I4C0_9TELE|nr:hypothetical protein EYF80_017582 [Liparis tanakae]
MLISKARRCLAYRRIYKTRLRYHSSGHQVSNPANGSIEVELPDCNDVNGIPEERKVAEALDL